MSGMVCLWSDGFLSLLCTTALRHPLMWNVRHDFHKMFLAMILTISTLSSTCAMDTVDFLFYAVRLHPLLRDVLHDFR